MGPEDTSDIRPEQGFSILLTGSPPSGQDHANKITNQRTQKVKSLGGIYYTMHLTYIQASKN